MGLGWAAHLAACWLDGGESAVAADGGAGGEAVGQPPRAAMDAAAVAREADEQRQQQQQQRGEQEGRPRRLAVREATAAAEAARELAEGGALEAILVALERCRRAGPGASPGAGRLHLDLNLNVLRWHVLGGAAAARRPRRARPRRGGR